jgi:hypothetical protein
MVICILCENNLYCDVTKTTIIITAYSIMRAIHCGELVFRIVAVFVTFDNLSLSIKIAKMTKTNMYIDVTSRLASTVSHIEPFMYLVFGYNFLGGSCFISEVGVYNFFNWGKWFEYRAHVIDCSLMIPSF